MAIHRSNITTGITRANLRGIPHAGDPDVLRSPGYLGLTANQVTDELRAAAGMAPKPVAAQTQATVPTNKGINPAYIVGGIAAAGIGADALETHRENRKHKPGMIETAGNAVVTAMDTTAGLAGSAIGIATVPMLPLFFGSLGVEMLGRPLAGITDYVTGTKATGNVVDKISGGLTTAQNATFSQVSKKIDPRLGGAVTSGIKKVASVGAPVLNTISKVPGLSGLHSQHIAALPENLSNVSAAHTMMRAGWIGGAGLGVYHAARSFGGQLYALRQLQADLTGKDVSDVSSFSVLVGGGLSKPAEEARKKFLAVSGTHAFTSAAALLMAVKSPAIDRMIGKYMGPIAGGMGGVLLMGAAYGVPEQISEHVKGIVGEPILEVYKGMSDAQKAGMKLAPEHYAQFLLRASEKLKNRGNVGEQYAMALGEQYAAENIALAKVVSEVHDGKMQARIDTLIKERSAAKAPEAPKESSFVDRIQPKTGQTAAAQPVMKPEVGEFTKNLNEQQRAAVIQGPPSIN